MEAAYEPKTLQDAVIYFADADNCLNYLAAKRWPNGVTCPTCGTKDVIFLVNQRRWKCGQNHERPQFSVKVGTVMEDSPIGLDKWLMAMWQIVNCQNGISSYEVHRAIGITQKSAWFLDHRIRFALGLGATNEFSGQIEADETFIGGKARNLHKIKRERVITGTGCKDKTALMGILERGGRVRTRVVGNTKKKTLQSELREHVLAGSTLFTDALKSYEGLNEFQGEVVDHAVEYLRGEVHTNGLENFPYLDERAFRYNHRKMNAGDRFDIVVRQIVGKRLTWDQLTGKTEMAEAQS